MEFNQALTSPPNDMTYIGGGFEEEEPKEKTFFELKLERDKYLKNRNPYNPNKEKHWIYDYRSKWEKFYDWIHRANKTGKFSGITCWIYKEDHDEQEERIKKIFDYEEKNNTISSNGGNSICIIPPSSTIKKLKDEVEKLKETQKERERLNAQDKMVLNGFEDGVLESILEGVEDKVEKIRRKIGFGRKLNDIEILSIKNEIQIKFKENNSMGKKELKKIIKKEIRSFDENKELMCFK